MSDFITIKGAREHNLKNITVKIPKNKLVVFSGVSGSGKSSLAMDTLYAEGQRRYVESLSSYARQFLGMMRRPDVDAIDGLAPAIAIDQHGLSHNPRSTVGTVTEIYDYLRLLYARIGTPHCPQCGREITRQTSTSITNQIINLIKDKIAIHKTARFLILAPVVRDKRGEFTKLFENLIRKGFEQIRVDGTIINLHEDILLIKTNRHDLDAVVDRLSFVHVKDLEKKEVKQRIQDSVEIALDLTDGMVFLSEIKDKGFSLPEKPKSFEDTIFSQRFACPVCNLSLPEVEPRLFSFNSPQGACPKCEGIGVIMRINSDLIVNRNLSVLEGGIIPWFRRFENNSWTRYALEKAAERHHFSLTVPIRELPENALKVLLYGDGYHTIGEHGFEGVATNLERRYRESDSDFIKEDIERYMYKETCPLCQGKRLKKETLGITVNRLNIADVSNLSLTDLYQWITDLKTSLGTNLENEVAKPLTKEIRNRLNFLVAVGVNYLTLNRSAATLSVGEAQRIRLASQIGTGLTGVLYVLDEPTVGLHQRDTQKLILTLKNLRDLGNTVIVVEHDKEVLDSSDYIIDFGPGAGKHGGQIVASGTPTEIKHNLHSLTGRYLSGKKKVAERSTIANSFDRGTKTKFQAPYPTDRRTSSKSLSISGCREHNLKNLTVNFPIGAFTCLTGVSGSGKSSLLHDTLYPAVKKKLDPYSRLKPGKYQDLTGTEVIHGVLMVDQSPIGRTSRSNPATYTGVWSEIRELFSQTKEARMRGFKPGHFSFNVDGGRCDACQGQGVIRVSMQFLPDVWVECEECRGTRFKNEILEVEYKEKNVAEILKMTVGEAIDFFSVFPKISRRLAVLKKIGLDYLQLGQSSPTLSGGESQRLKLARELVKPARNHTLYLLDEPTTGLHFADVEKLLIVVRELVNKDNTVIMIEHNLDVIKNADWIIDLGPGGGEEGGKMVAEGVPDKIAHHQKSWTGKYLLI